MTESDSSVLFRVVSKALALVGAKPTDFSRALEAAAAFEDEAGLRLDAIVAHLEKAPADDPTRLLLHQRLARWDALTSPDWAGDTAAQTQQRRALIYMLLDLPDHVSACFQQHFPPHITVYPEFTISKKFERWFDDEEQEAAGFYWPRYRDYLEQVERWPVPSTASLQRASTAVVERLGQPTRDDRYQARGLVVGFVQSGKTANFTGVIARAVDAGYRFVIVLAGTTDLLREQTQRRLDKQLIGKEALLGLAGAADEYSDARDWDRFISYGAEPGVLGAPDWVRLTTLTDDYKRLGSGPGLDALRFERLDATKPLNDPSNLRGMRVRLVVAKKNRAPLDRLAKDLEQLERVGFSVSDIPTLIIDDESDQASINTKKPTKKEIIDRTAINAAITQLLSLLRRAQYVGYTATPFANVFVDPDDELGIFPRDFIVSLERPVGYMGATDYHDFGANRLGFESNERAYVRPVFGEDTAQNNLQRALDCYLLSGAIKLFRAHRGIDVNYRHHTMLVHTSSLTDDHERMAHLIDDIFESGGYWDGSAEPRLSTLLASDFRPVSEAKNGDLDFPDSFEDCRPFLEECLARLQRGTERVLIVNGRPENDPMSPDFDRDDVWKIIVGGTKLSRGYTVEGLTVSYYRRTSIAADTLMQMGRWFGFRRNYFDLMRLFVGRAEPRKPRDLYAAFEAICQDELEFRDELVQYALPTDGSEPITPMQVAPLVTQHLGDVPPTSPNKMYNAYIQSQNFGGKTVARTLAPTAPDDVEENQRLARNLMSKARDNQAPILGGADESFDSLSALCSPSEMIEFLRAYKWSRPGILDRVVSFLDGTLGDPEIERWRLVWPLLENPTHHGTWTINGDAVTVIERFRNENGRFGVYTAPAHVAAARMLALLEDLDSATPDTRSLAAEHTGVALLYAVKGPEDSDVSIGFYLLPPRNRITEKIRWAVRVKAAEDEPIVNVDET
jgi:hypothetical protein